jgi:hypothetical protein
MIEVVEKKSNYPLIVSFPLEPNKSDLQVSVGIKQIGKQTRTVITSVNKTNEISYKGYNFGEYTNEKDTCEFAIGVFNKNKNEFKVYKTDHVYVMKPQFNKQASSIPIRDSIMSSYERRQTLTEEFGSRKKKRANQAAQSNTISVENISGANAVETILSSNKKSEEDNKILKDAAERSFKRPRKKF